MAQRFNPSLLEYHHVDLFRLCNYESSKQRQSFNNGLNVGAYNHDPNRSNDDDLMIVGALILIDHPFSNVGYDQEFIRQDYFEDAGFG